MINKVFTAIRFAGQLIDTETILGVDRFESPEGGMNVVLIVNTNLKPYVEYYNDKNAAEIRSEELAADFGFFQILPEQIKSVLTWQLYSIKKKEEGDG